MSTDATSPSGKATTATGNNASPNSPAEKGKGKAAGSQEEEDENSDSESEDDEDSEDSDAMDEDEEEDNDNEEKIDPSKILPRRTRGLKIDYSSAEAFKKAGLEKKEDGKDSDSDEEMA